MLKHTTDAPILQIALALSNSPFLMAVHMSDNGLRSDPELFHEVLEIFGEDKSVLQELEDRNFKVNKRVYKTASMKRIIKGHT